METAKRYTKNERETLEALISARRQAVTATDAAAIQKMPPSEAGPNSSLGKLFPFSEA